VNFPDETPCASPKRSVRVNMQKPLPKAKLNSVQPNLDQNFNFRNNSDQEYSMGLMEEKPFTNEYGYMDSVPVNGDVGFQSFVSSDAAPMYFNSDQGSNSFDCSDFGWGEQGPKTPEISSVLSATLEGDESKFLEDANPKKKLKSESGSVVSVENNTPKTLSEELSAFESQMNFQMPYLDGSWDASIETLFSGSTTQDGGNSMDLWSFDDLPAMAGGVY
jgi:EREBP-like factor